MKQSILKRCLGLSLALMLVGSVTACGPKDGGSGGGAGSGNAATMETVSNDTLGGKYVNAFLASEGEDSKAVVEELLEADYMSDLVEMDVAPGYLDGFDKEIKGFTKGVKFSPMIGSIPFVAYVLETEDVEALKKELSDQANPAWNICTQADETQMADKNNLVFFIMCSNED